jgi:hypothetical protein
MDELRLENENVEIEGADHASIINQGVADIFAFFEKHTR